MLKRSFPKRISHLFIPWIHLRPGIEETPGACLQKIKILGLEEIYSQSKRRKFGEWVAEEILAS